MNNPFLPRAEVESWKPPVIDTNEFVLQYTRSSGPGGQKVNKTSSAVLLRWPISSSASLTNEQKQRLTIALKNRINAEGELILKVQELRSQKQNLDRAIELIAEMVEKALQPQILRKETKPSKGAKNRRMDEKSHRGDIKAKRRKPSQDD